MKDWFHQSCKTADCKIAMANMSGDAHKSVAGRAFDTLGIQVNIPLTAHSLQNGCAN